MFGEPNLGAVLFLAFILVQRLSELMIAKRNTSKLLEQGAVEIGAGHYPVMVAMHTAWILTLVILGYSQSVSPFWLVLFAILQLFRIWILKTLGSRWTTRIIVLDEPLVKRGPFQYFNHPNYVLVVLEIVVAPMALGLWVVAFVFTVLNAAMLFVRISAEESAIKHLRK